MAEIAEILPPGAATADPHDARSAEILAAIRQAFIEKGFDGASMQDLARAAGMSVGNFYRYFSSKAAIVEAFITRDLVMIEAEFAAVQESSDPMGRLREALHRKVTEELCSGDEGRLWAEMQAVALRKPEIGTITQRMETLIVTHLTRAFALATGLTDEEAAARFDAQARLIMMLVKAAGMSLRDGTGGDAGLTAELLRVLDGTLDEIARAAVRG